MQARFARGQTGISPASSIRWRHSFWRRSTLALILALWALSTLGWGQAYALGEAQLNGWNVPGTWNCNDDTQLDFTINQYLLASSFDFVVTMPSANFTVQYIAEANGGTNGQTNGVFSYLAYTQPATNQVRITGSLALLRLSGQFKLVFRSPGMGGTVAVSGVPLGFGVAGSKPLSACRPALRPLTGVAIPQDAKLSNFVADMQAARVLGKALFWDTAVGSDGQQACASCHFHAGADMRTKNQIHPGADGVYQPTRSGNTAAVNYIMRPEDFPFHVLADPNDRNSAVLFDTNDRLSSQGVLNSRFVGATAGAATDQCDLVFDSRFHVNGVSTRKVEPRNTPTTINAVFNLRNFWDGRANETFNGVTPFGPRDSSAGIYKWNGLWWDKIKPNLYFASLASQAVGPALSDFEMACAGRIWPNVGRRLLNRIPLATQTIASNDSLLAPYRAGTGKGLTQTYSQLITKAFKSAYLNNSTKVSIGGQSYTISEANFSFFFGVAVQLYEATLVSDDAPLDRYLNGSDRNALTAQEVSGMNLFQSKAKCTECHNGPQLTNAGTPSIEDFTNGAIINYMAMGDGQAALYDEGFYNIGVRPTAEDLGVGGLDPFGNPLSFARQYKTKLGNLFYAYVDPRLTVNPCTFDVNPCATPSSKAREAVDGAFKVPTLRNVELTGPYFHNGSRKSLEEVIEFYNRGGDSRGTQASNTSGYGANGSNLDADIQPLGLTAQEQADLAAFLKRPLTDQRVLCDRAPFDHPELRVPNGHVGDNRAVAVGANGAAQDDWLTVPAVGANGMCGSDLSGRRLTFVEILNQNATAQVSSADALQPQALVLNMPLNPDALAMPEPLLAEVPVAEVQVEGAESEVIEENVAVIEETSSEENNTEENAAQPQRSFLPIVTK